MYPRVNSHSPIAPYNNQSYEPTFLSPRHLDEISCWVDRNGLTQPSYTFPANPHEIKCWYDKYNQRYYIHCDDKNKEIIRDVNGYIHFQYRMHTYNQTPQYSGMHQLCIPGASLPSSLSRPIANFHAELESYNPPGSTGYFNSNLGRINDSLSHRHSFNSLRSSGPQSFSSMHPKPKLHSMVSPRVPEDDDDECVSGKTIKGKPKPVKKSNSDLMSEIASADLIIANDDENSLLLLNQLLQLVRKEQKNTAINIYTIELASFLKLIGESRIAEDTAHKLRLNITITEKLNGFLKLETVEDIKNLSYLELKEFEKPILKKLLQFEKLIKNPYTLESIFAFFNLYQLPPNLQRENYTIISLLELVNYKGFEIITAINVLNEMKLS